MTEEQKFQMIHEISMKFMCTPCPETKMLSLAYNASVSEEARALHRESLVVDTCGFGLEDYSWHLEQAGLSAINCTVPGVKDSADGAMRNFFDYYETVNDNSDKLMFIRTVDDIYRAKREGKTGVIIGAQSCEFVDHDELEASLEVFARAGLRIMQIGYNHRTFAADGCFTGTDAGITKDGKRLIRAMERAGVIVDLSHVGRRSSLEAMDYCEKPAIFSHSNPDKLFPTPRNITDEQIKKCAEHGGVMGVCSYNVMLWNGREFPTIDHFVDCIAYYADLVGIDHVGLGVDSSITPGSYPHREVLYFSKLARSQGDSSFAYKSAVAGRGLFGKFPEGLESHANIPCVVDRMLKRGFSKEDVKKVLGENWIRVFAQWWNGGEAI